MDISYWIDLVVAIILGSVLIFVSFGKLIDLTSYGIAKGNILLKVLGYAGLAIIVFQSTELISRIFV
ncbi:hypothetical protein H4J56_19225 [Colwellia sp. BRX8-4]|jgi:hypothetical protein|uniref:hypothetical protein n=1 Tax=Colwellia sp. BRX8-4 TaxID=2759836 RepID=UPI0015F3B018|nr:hypothetical protein [Colwellia sp. BRX8-4]MBA6373546.1 hypothetical protein [Colwellia sp. BRX8-4]